MFVFYSNGYSLLEKVLNQHTAGANFIANDNSLFSNCSLTFLTNLRSFVFIWVGFRHFFGSPSKGFDLNKRTFYLKKS